MGHRISKDFISMSKDSEAISQTLRISVDSLEFYKITGDLTPILLLVSTMGFPFNRFHPSEPGQLNMTT